MAKTDTIEEYVPNPMAAMAADMADDLANDLAPEAPLEDEEQIEAQEETPDAEAMITAPAEGSVLATLDEADRKRVLDLVADKTPQTDAAEQERTETDDSAPSAETSDDAEDKATPESEPVAPAADELTKQIDEVEANGYDDIAGAMRSIRQELAAERVELRKSAESVLKLSESIGAEHAAVQKQTQTDQNVELLASVVDKMPTISDAQLEHAVHLVDTGVVKAKPGENPFALAVGHMKDVLGVKIGGAPRKKATPSQRATASTVATRGGGASETAKPVGMTKQDIQEDLDSGHPMFQAILEE